MISMLVVIASCSFLMEMIQLRVFVDLLSHLEQRSELSLNSGEQDAKGNTKGTEGSNDRKPFHPERSLGITWLGLLTWAALELTSDNAAEVSRAVGIKNLLHGSCKALLAADAGAHVLQQLVIIMHLVCLDHVSSRCTSIRHGASLPLLHLLDLSLHVMRTWQLEGSCKHLGEPPCLDRGCCDVREGGRF